MIEENDEAPEGSSLSAGANAILKNYYRIGKPLFAAVDGASYADLPGLLQELDLPHSSLFLEHADKQVELAGGWLVTLKSEEDLSKLLSIADDCSSLVLWTCADGEAILYRHLRSINLVSIPAPSSTEQSDQDGSDEAAEAGRELVSFRHYDPEVVASLLPLFDKLQFGRLFGPATQIAMYAADFGGFRMAFRPDDLPIMPKTPLRITQQQMEDLENVRQAASAARIAAYLRKADPVRSARMDDEKLRAFAVLAHESGTSMGLRSERAIGYWAFLNMGSKARIATDPQMRDLLTNYPQYGSADDRLFTLMNRLSKVPTTRFQGDV